MRAGTRLVRFYNPEFGDAGVVDRDSNRRAVLVRVVEPIPLLDLVGAAARAIGATQELATTTDFALTQHWARRIYEELPDLHGIRWRGRQSGSICVILTDRADMRRLRREVDLAIGDRRAWRRISRVARELRIRRVG